MKVTFDYNEEKDVWCLLNYGKSSNNSNASTKRYQELVIAHGGTPTKDDVAAFVKKYLSDNKFDMGSLIINYQNDWQAVASEYQKIAETIFKVSLPNDITAYLTVNNRCPYNIDNNFFFMSLSARYAREITMHELWHFYTWYKFGIIWEEKIGKQKYNDLKEALTVLLNIECKNLFPEGSLDIGYPQHKELREKITHLWAKTKDIDKLWKSLVL